jgi:hypothetical protein
MPADEKRRERELAELAALADGSLPPHRRAELERRVAASPRLQALLREQQEALEAVRGLDQRAPDRLRQSISAIRVKPPRRRLRRRVALGAAAAGGIAALVLLVLPASEPGTPTLAEAAAIATKAPTALPSGQMEAWGIDYPDLRAKHGWRMTGSRTDRLGERAARTVFYAKDGRRIAYTILAAGSVRDTGATRTWRRHGSLWYAFEQQERTVVAWERKGHMCVVSADGLRGRRLVQLITQ